jgi:methylmalonyl-CoA mutase C-terminal domain/subunit
MELRQMVPLRILIAKPGLDGHDRGAKIVARAFRDDGWEVVYTGLRQVEEHIAAAAVQEDVAVVGISDLGAIHVPVIERLAELLEEQGRPDMVIVAGGTFVEEDLVELHRLGVAACYGPGTDTRRLTSEVRRFVEEEAGFARLRKQRSAAPEAPR